LVCYSCAVLKALLLTSVLSSCRRAEPTPANDLSDQIQRSEQRAAERDTARVCERPVAVLDEPIADLDRVVTKSTRVRFTLDYPFERPFAGVITGKITLRRTIDGIRAALRTMYEGSTQRDLPELENKEVTGPYGKAFHVISDLIIEQIDLCADDTLSIYIGS
jgi:hypothetical protein